MQNMAYEFFFFKRRTAYGIRLSLVGSGMCIRDGYGGYEAFMAPAAAARGGATDAGGQAKQQEACPLNTSDAADE